MSAVPGARYPAPMRRTAVLGTLLLPAAATAAEVDLPSMLEHDGLPVLDSAILGDA